MLHTLHFSLQNAVYFIMLSFLVYVLVTFYIQYVLKLNVKFKVYKSVHHRTIQINHKPDATIFQFIILTFVYSSTCFGRFPAHHQEHNDCSGSLWFYIRIVVTVVLCSWSGRPARPTTNTAHVSGVFPPIIRSTMTAVAASGFTFVSW
jgi:UDP-N-acetylglucosamine:LPS N-acetylglucosamine transferase